MEWSAAAGIAAVTLGLVLTPGPNMIHLVPRSVTQGRRAGLHLPALAALDVRRVTVGGSLARAMYAQLHRAALELRVRGTFTYADDQMSQDDLNDIFSPRPSSA